MREVDVRAERHLLGGKQRSQALDGGLLYELKEDRSGENVYSLISRFFCGHPLFHASLTFVATTDINFGAHRRVGLSPHAYRTLYPKADNHRFRIARLRFERSSE